MNEALVFLYRDAQIRHADAFQNFGSGIETAYCRGFKEGVREALELVKAES